MKGIPVLGARNSILQIFAIWISVLLSGCVTSFSEQHFFQTVDDRGEPTNYYKLNVDGKAVMSAARYVSGYYDERAVDLFFDELQLAPTTITTPNTRQLFVNSGAGATFQPLSPNGEDGAFVMVLSNNASAVTSAIGQFAENQIVAEAMTNLANRDLFLDAQGVAGSPRFEADQAAAASSEITALMALVPTHDSSPEQEEVTRSLLRVLTAIARSQGSDESFTSFMDAQSWFDGRQP